MGKVLTAAMVEFRAGYHRLFILHHVHCMGKIVTAAIAEVGEGGEKFDGRIGSRSSHTVHSSWCSRSKKKMRNAMEEV
eukprot:12059061-Ditylum_brightwellii.AAC.1